MLLTRTFAICKFTTRAGAIKKPAHIPTFGVNLLSEADEFARIKHLKDPEYIDEPKSIDVALVGMFAVQHGCTRCIN